jgi:hypothetical protein
MILPRKRYDGVRDGFGGEVDPYRDREGTAIDSAGRFLTGTVRNRPARKRSPPDVHRDTSGLRKRRNLL